MEKALHTFSPLLIKRIFESNWSIGHCWWARRTPLPITTTQNELLFFVSSLYSFFPSWWMLPFCSFRPPPAAAAAAMAWNFAATALHGHRIWSLNNASELHRSLVILLVHLFIISTNLSRSAFWVIVMHPTLRLNKREIAWWFLFVPVESCSFSFQDL